MIYQCLSAEQIIQNHSLISCY